ncbi:unnamed protein product [Taenia asiatica]|uniref:Uncharacterized protein n=1 Tax=Taenia asiatica TaxID=60517 RepID=A0A0R3W9I6_TAEAS|nr:unnamed protein product [Taenia asiatica]
MLASRQFYQPQSPNPSGSQNFSLFKCKEDIKLLKKIKHFTAQIVINLGGNNNK